jgi:acetyl-CoA carboxylase biotin carboxylase subunit
VEESPSPVVTPEMRKEMGAAAVRIGQAVKYTNAGTVEFLVDRDGKFYFMEMNTRLQVEHGVTEIVLGIDLVREQLLIAAGEKMSLPSTALGIRGACIECRVNAEDPEHNFAPCPGRIQALHLPGGPGVRVDTHIYDSYTVPQFYDSLLAKVMTHGRNRDEAIARMYRALGEFVIEGIKTNIPFMREVINSETFRRSVYSTRFLEHFRLTEV